MLRGMRKASSNWLGRIVMAVVLGAIAVSFAIWGINDIFRGFGRSTVAKIGSTEIGVEQFRQLYNDRIQQLSREIGRPVTPEMARQFRLDQLLVNQLMNDAALDQRARALRLNVADAEVARQIMADPMFKGPGGQFERARFDALLRNNGYNEPRFAAERKRLILRRELMDTVGSDVEPPKTMAQAYNRFVNEQRAVDFVILTRDKAGDVPPPAADVLTKYFEDNKFLFRAPEYRGLVLMTLTAPDLAKPDDVSEADARRYYELNLSRFGTTERRQLQQIVFPNADEAKAAAEKLGETLSFEALAKERGLEQKDIDLGLLTKAAIIDRNIADAAFSLKEGEVSQPINGTFGTVLIKVVKVEPEQVKKFEEVAGEIKQTIALDRARNELSSLRDKVEDERGGGLKLTEIAQKLNLKAQTIAAVDRAGLDPDGKQVAGLPTGVDLLTAAFGSDVGVDSEALQLPAGGFIWYDVTGVKPSRERSLDEVRAKVEERWRDEEVGKRLKAKAAEMVEKLKGGAPFADVAKADGLTVQTTFGLKRAGNRATALSTSAIAAVFETPKDSAGSAEGTSPTEWVVFRVTDVTVPDFDAASGEAKRMGDQLRRSFTEDLLGQYVQRLQNEIGGTVNQRALRQAVAGGGAGDDNN
jgi:peptidyl-prolyl cis-trans isomerase D